MSELEQLREAVQLLWDTCSDGSTWYQQRVEAYEKVTAALDRADREAESLRGVVQAVRELADNADRRVLSSALRAALAAAGDAPQPARLVEWPHPADPHGAAPDEVHQSAVDLLGDCVQRLGSHHPLTEHIRLFADAGPSPAVLPGGKP